MSKPEKQAEKQSQPNWLHRKWRLLLGLSLSALCIYLAVHDVSLPAIKNALGIAQWEWVLLATVVLVVSLSLKALRWQLLFLPQQISYRRVWSVYMIGQMLNAVFPARAGDIGRIYFIGDDHRVSRAAAFSTVIVEKIVDLAMLSLAYLLVTVWLAIAPTELPTWLKDAGTLLIPMTALALAGLLLFASFGRRLWNTLRKGLSPLPLHWQETINAAAEKAIIPLEAFRRSRAMLPVLVWSLVVWALMALTNALLFPAFHLDLPPFVALLLMVVLMSGVAVPPLPGNLGIFAYLCQLVLTLFGVDRETALVYGITLQAVVYLPQIVLGVSCLLGENRLRRDLVASEGAQ